MGGLYFVLLHLHQFRSVQFSCSGVSNSAVAWSAAHQASLSITISRSFFKLMSIKSVMPLNHIVFSKLSQNPAFFCISTLRFHTKYNKISHRFTHYRTQHHPEVSSSQPITEQYSNILRALGIRTESAFFFKELPFKGLPKCTSLSPWSITCPNITQDTSGQFFKYPLVYTFHFYLQIFSKLSLY